MDILQLIHDMDNAESLEQADQLCRDFAYKLTEHASQRPLDSRCAGIVILVPIQVKDGRSWVHVAFQFYGSRQLADKVKRAVSEKLFVD